MLVVLIFLITAVYVIFAKKYFVYFVLFLALGGKGV